MGHFIVSLTSLCDPEEALSDGLEVALKRYNGLGNPATFVSACARNAALRYYSRRVRRQFSFDEVMDSKRYDFDDAVVDLFGVCDSEFVEPIDPFLIEGIRRALAKMVNYKVRSTRPTVIAAAQKILLELCDSANRGQGVGVSEYDDAPQKAPDYAGQVHLDRNTKVARQEMYRHLAERCGTDTYTVTYAMTALRKSAEIALRERQLTE